MKIKIFTFMKSLFAKTLVLHPRALLYHFSAARDFHTQTEIKAVFLFHKSHSQYAHLHFLITNTALPSDLGNTLSPSAQYKMHPKAVGWILLLPWMVSTCCRPDPRLVSSPGWNGLAPPYYLLPKTLSMTLEKGKTITKTYFPAPLIQITAIQITNI